MTELDVRARLLAALEADLVGPFVPDADATAQEILPLPPSRWYLTGFLAPQAGRAPDADDALGEGELAAGSASRAEDAGSDEPEPKRPVRFPASMGLSVFLPPAGTGTGDDGDGADVLDVEVRYADYEPVEVAQDHESRKRTGWQRVPRGPARVQVPLDRAALERGVAVPDSRGLRLRGELRRVDADADADADAGAGADADGRRADTHAELVGLPAGARILSLFLVNERAPATPPGRDDQAATPGRARREYERDRAYAFQVGLTLRYPRGFLSRPNRRGEDADDQDQRVLALLFRDHEEWAVGHNTSPAAPAPDPDGAVRALSTTQLPHYEVPIVRHREVPGLVTEMKTLAQLAAGDGSGLERALSPLCEAYGAWIDRCRYADLPRASLEQTRDVLMDQAARARRRMAAGIAVLVGDDQVRLAFQLANQAMHVAALQADKAREGKRYADGAQPAWHPFQLAFVVMNLAAIADPGHPDRAVADLIYFPTGGGKTEAYLGLIACTLLLRRLRGKPRPDEGRGVAVILRYTLRLLTLDQLGRAASLICALEELRRRRPRELGNARFTVGLWVGQSATANRLTEVHATLHDYTPGRQDSPFPLTRCPWCGADLRIENIKLVDDAGKPSKTRYTRAVVYCAGAGCLFTEGERPGQGLPVLFVDEQIYQELPDFVVATVDKFALMPWRGEAGMLFGRATHVDPRRAYGVMHAAPAEATPVPDGLLPPELIVQDELHLISGPLGTMVGLYEAAVDALCERALPGDPAGRRHGPKIVCSTATARRAQEQIRALFHRELALFPPRGIDQADNFFAREDRDRPGRLYVGVAAPGRALRAVSVRVYAGLLAAAQKHADASAATADPYMTLVGYFNSLRELGGMRRLVEEEVRNRVERFDRDKRPHEYAGPHPWAADRRIGLPAELTSRVGSEEVKQTKQRLATRTTGGGESVDVVLASSMISVGLDVDRLGLMVVTGQPKTTSEYIQATSRVGRAYPGLVVTCLSVMRPRDRSHYERFWAYHHSFYRDVEATSVTPFSGQTLDRGLVGTLISMIRHGVPAMEPPEGVMALHDHRQEAERMLAWLVRRAGAHRDWPDDAAQARIADLVRRRGRNFLDAWERVVTRTPEGGGGRIYSKMDRAGEKGKPVLFMPTDEPPPDHDARQFEAPTSMRDVEPSVPVWLRFKPLDDRL